MTGIAATALIVYAAGAVGFAASALFAAAAGRLGGRYGAVFMPYTAGLLIAFVCFEILPRAFLMGGMAPGIAGILAGAAVAAFIDARMEKSHSESASGTTRSLGLLLAGGIAVHKLPEGMALGGVFAQDMAAGLSLAAIIAAHCFPEGLAVFVSLREEGARMAKLIAISFLICLPMGVGGGIGAAAGAVSGIFTSWCLSFAGGVMIYITCGEMLPESAGLRGKGLSTAAACAGFICGVVLTAKL